MAYEYITRYDSPNFGYPAGARGGNNPTHIIIHHWGADGYSFQGVINGLCRPGGSSAHYVAMAGKVACIVDESNCAWHAGSYKWNTSSIGIECRPEMTDEDFDTVAQLIADIWKRRGKLPIIGHRDVASTYCPGRYYARLGELASLANKYYNGASPAPVKSDFEYDGVWGRDTTTKAQQYFKTPVDGEVSSQLNSCRQFLPSAHSSSWEFLENATGSVLIRKIQGIIGASTDGLAGSEFASKLQAYLNGYGTGLAVDGIMGEATTTAFQKLVTGKLKKPEPKAEPKSETKKDGKMYRVQVGAFSDKKNAEKLSKELESKGYKNIIK